MKDQSERVVLIGFMGAGKTSVGEQLAERLGFTFLDTDHEIERKTARTIPEIFREDGEPAFRQIERKVIAELLEEEKKVVLSLGGGAYIQEEVRQVASAKAEVFFLDISWEAWKERLPTLIEGRPKLESQTLEDLYALYQTRRVIYAEGSKHILTDGLTIEEVVEKLVHTLS
ncbi:shikimate kinase [Salsuginibacillus kocurii]|uniref:shikimate kinase n=1 Tax=Salsuginibacillus kocurii TaxID=427078 RepID=UPI00035E4DB7|nr:shikimate kinase [Salsuginibacillus kocurii]